MSSELTTFTGPLRIDKPAKYAKRNAELPITGVFTMRFARIHAALPVAVALLAGVPLLSQQGDARATPGESAQEKDPAAVLLAQGDKGGGKKDLESLQGTWNIDTIGWTGKDLPKELTKGYKFVFAGNKLTWDAAIGMMSKGGKITAIDGTFPCDFKIDPSKKPKQIDITIHLKQGDATFLGIYEIKG